MLYKYTIGQQNKYNMNQPQKQQIQAPTHQPPPNSHQNTHKMNQDHSKQQHIKKETSQSNDPSENHHRQKSSSQNIDNEGPSMIKVEQSLDKKQQKETLIKKPVQTSMPWPKVEAAFTNPDTEGIIPCTFTAKEQKQRQENSFNNKDLSLQEEREREGRNNGKNTEQSMLDSKISVQKQQIQRSKVVTGVLVDKIALLEKMVRDLQEEKNMYREKLKESTNIAFKPQFYQSTPHSPTKMGMIRKNTNNQSNKVLSKESNFNTISETNQTSNKNFRVRPFNPNSNQSLNVKSNSSFNKLHSNIFSLVVMQSNQQNSIKTEMNLLKEKLALLQKKQKIDEEKNQLLEEKNKFLMEKSSQNNSKNNISSNNALEEKAHDLAHSRRSNVSIKSNHSLNKSKVSQRSRKSGISQRRPSEAVHEESEKQREWKREIEMEKEKMKQRQEDLRKKIQNLQRENERKQIQMVSPNRKIAQGKIIRRNSSLNSSMNSSFGSKENGDINPTPKGFVRSDPRGNHSAAPQNLYSEFDQQNSNIFQREESLERKKIERVDSAAIFRKNPGPALQRGQSAQEYVHQFGTLQFNPEKQKFIVSDSKDSEMNERDQFQKKQYRHGKMQDIYIPELIPCPTPQCSSQELIEIGKITFQKFGSEITENTSITVKKYKNCVYFSISIDQNILWHYEGKFYYGGWRTMQDGEEGKSGEGLEFVPGKYKYKGFFVQGKKSGYGVMINDSGVIYQGQWQDGLRHGTGQQKSEDGSIYDGQWRSGKRNGFGRIYTNQRLQFQGLFQKGLKHGHGKEYFQNGDFYEGQYQQNKFEGKGTYRWSTGAEYVGQFKNGQRDGQGVWKAQNGNGDYYQGSYEKDLKNGYGVYHWANGSSYSGNFKNDLKHGEGTITYENGKVAHLVWDQGNAQKKLQMSSRFQTPDRSLSKKNNSGTPQRGNNLGNRNFGNARSVQNLQSAKSTSTLGQRSLPKGISTRGFHAKKPIQTRVKGGQLIKLKIGEDLKELRQQRPSKFSKSKREGNGGMPKDAPYRGVQMTANPNMYL